MNESDMSISNERLWAAGSILLYPIVIENKFYKGIMLVVRPETLLFLYPDIKKYFILVSETMWTGWSHSNIEDIHALPVASQADLFLKEFPQGKYIVLNGADFCNKNTFHVIETEKKYDIIFVSRVSQFKRHEMLIKILRILRGRYGRNLKVLVVAMSLNNRVNIANFFRHPLTLKNIFRNIRQEFYAPVIKYLYKKAIENGFNITLVTKWRSHKELCVLFNKSRCYLLLAKNEGGNRAARQAMLCDVPVILIKGSQPAEANVSNLSGIAVEDNPEIIAQKVIEMVDSRSKTYSPRQWALELGQRWRLELWEAVNSIQRFPGYPDIHRANEIRSQFTEKADDNYIDLNHRGEQMELSEFERDITRIREKKEKN